MNSVWCHLNEIAHVHLGYKSLQNDFFYVSSNTIKQYGIEESYLRKIFVLSDFDTKSFFQTPAPSSWLLYCRSPESELRGTGVLKYIQAMAGHRATAKKQDSGKPSTIKKVLSEQGGRLWYAPKATPHTSQIWLRKAFAGVFAPFLFEKPVCVDQRCNRVEPLSSVTWKELASVMTSSLFALALEGDGASSMGGGALEWKTKSLRDARVIDVRKFSSSERAKLVQLAEATWENAIPTDFSRMTPPISQVKALDAYILKRIGNPVSLEQLYGDLRETAAIRLKKTKVRKASHKSSEKADIKQVAESIASSVRHILDAHRFPEDFLPAGSRTQTFKVPHDRELIVVLDRFMNFCRLCITDSHGSEYLDNTHPAPLGELTMKALMLGRREFPVPIKPEIADSALTRLSGWMDELREEIRKAVLLSALGTKFEEQLEAAVLLELGIMPVVYSDQIWGRYLLSPTS